MSPRTIGGLTYSKPWLILCEGLGDKMVIHEVITKDRNLHGVFDVHFPAGNGASGGRGKFGNWLANQPQISPTFREHTRAVLIISDADVDRLASFNEIRTLLDRNGLPAPNAEGEIAKSENFPACVVIHLLPHDRSGSIDTLCTDALESQWSVGQKITEFTQHTPASAWTATRASKSRLHVAMAVTCADKPDTTLAGIFQTREKYRIPVEHTAFNDLRAKLNLLAKIPL